MVLSVMRSTLLSPTFTSMLPYQNFVHSVESTTNFPSFTVQFVRCQLFTVFLR